MSSSTPDRDHEALREQLGTYVLRGLDADARTELENHLAECPACRAELDAIAPLAAPLSHVRADETAEPFAPTAHPTPGGFAAILERVHDEQGHRSPTAATAAVPQAPVVDLATRRRSRLFAVAAAAVIAVAGLGIGYGVGAGSGGPDPEPVTVQALDPAIEASAGTIDHTWGVEMVLTASGFVEGQVYEVTVLDRAGRPAPAGAFRGTGPTQMVCRLNTSVLRDQAGGFVVTDAAGDEVLRSRFV